MRRHGDLQRRFGVMGLMTVLATASLSSGCEPREGKHVPLPGRDDYREGEKADAELAKLLARAQRQGRDVVLVMGGDWSKWCHAFQTTMYGDPEVADLIAKRYAVLTVDSDSNPEVVARFANPPPADFPFVVILDANGKMRASSDTMSWRMPNKTVGYQAKKLHAFFTKHASPTE